MTATLVRSAVRRPVLALVADAATAPRAVPLLALLGVDAHITSFHRPGRGLVSTPDALLVTDPSLLVGLPAVPTAVWVGADLVEVDSRRVKVPQHGIEVSRWPVVPPLVRARWRARFDLADQLVLAVDASSRPADAHTALALASAAVVAPELVPLALALGTPTVTRRATASLLGLEPGVEVEVADEPAEADQLAARIAADPARCARLSRLGRRAAEDRLDLGRPAARLRTLLGLLSTPVADASEVVVQRLAELATPPGATVVDRARRALDDLPVLVPSPAGVRS